MSSIYGPPQPSGRSRVPVTAEADAWSARGRSWQARIRPWVAWGLAVVAVVRLSVDPQPRYVGAVVALTLSGMGWRTWLLGRVPHRGWWGLGASLLGLAGLWLLFGR